MIANGVLVSVQHHAASQEFPGGSVTWNWHAGRPIASYLVEDSVGTYSLTSRVVNGIRFYQAQDTAIGAAQQQKNLAIMDMQPDITAFESQFSGTFPFASDGIIIGTPDASFDEEMEGMIAFAGGVIDTDTLYHENMHQWWGDNISEGGSLFDTSNTYNRPGAAYIALRQILGPARFDAALRQLQRTYGGSSISEAQLEAVFGQWLPVRSTACQQRLSQFFTQWFDTAYPPGGGANRPMITGPGLAGPGFYSTPGVCG